MDMSKDSGKHFLTWMKSAIAPILHRGSREATVHPMSVPGGKPCFAVTIDQCWLCGDDGALTLFDSLAAAAHFLNLLNIEGFAHGEPSARGIELDEARQCFQLGRNGLTGCQECRTRKAPVPRKPAGYPQWVEEDWSRWDEED